MVFSEIIGQKELVKSLKELVDNNRVPHSLLFSEEPGYGALSLVLALTQYLFCKTRRALASGDDTWVIKGLFGDEPTSLPKGDSCQVCSSCIKIRNLTHPDFHFLFPINTTQLVEKGKKVAIDQYYEIFRSLVNSNVYFKEQELYNAMELENKMGLIGVNEAAWLINKLSFTPYEGGNKVVLVMFPERMNAEAANKLLKSIEEPTSNTYFFMVTHNQNAILKTIRSRCRLIEVPPIEKEELQNAIAQKYKIEPQEALEWARCSQGSMGKAIELIDQSEEEKADFEEFTQLFKIAAQGDLVQMIALSQELAKLSKERQKQFCKNSLKLLRQLYLYKLGSGDLAYSNPGQVEEIEQISKGLPIDFFEKGYSIFNKTIEHIQQNVNAKMNFCNMCNSLYINLV